MPSLEFEEIGNKVNEILTQLSRHATQTDELREYFSHLKQMQTITTATRRTYTQVTTTPTPEINRIREVQ